MKKYTLLGLLFLLFGAINALSGTYSGGDGTSGTPYQISTIADLIELSNTSSDWTGKYFIQTANIVFNADSSPVDWDGNGTVEWSGNDQYGFSPIGNNDTNFTGSYNGQNHTISNLYINRTSSSYIGLFGRTGRAVQSAISGYLMYMLAVIIMSVVSWELIITAQSAAATLLAALAGMLMSAVSWEPIWWVAQSAAATLRAALAEAITSADSWESYQVAFYNAILRCGKKVI
ncbi:MAG TPA: hypothetical protein PLE30_07850, partial [Candidatus Kapabacteria bacterium]|nr:hypothetical protein [Candidatus Kapabacteria bacterium]